MKTQIILGMSLMFGSLFFANAQDVASTTTLTSGGNTAGNAGSNNAFYGYRAGDFNTASGINNTFIGHESGVNNSNGTRNTFLGQTSGYSNTSGSRNLFLGTGSGYANTTGSYNVALGPYAGDGMQTGNYNVYVGTYSGSASGTSLSTGSDNTFIGYYSGRDSNGSGNIFIGKNAGNNISGSNLLHISNTSDTTPLIWGNFSSNRLVFNGKVGITNETLVNQANLFPSMAGGVDVSSYQLFVKGGILTEEVRVQLKTAWADYVFNDEYKLSSLDEVEQYIQKNGHLPNVPSAKEVKENGLELGEIAKIQQEKIEELTLYVIQQKKEIDALKAQMEILLEQKQ